MEQHLTARLRIVRLIEAYGGLLTVRQRRMLRTYYLDDFSLSEIAEHAGITRQAVYDSVKRSVDELNRLEGALRLLAMTDQDSRQKEQLAARLETLERTVKSVGGKIGQRALTEISEQLAALRRLCL